VKRLLVATTNPGKQGEFRRLLGPLVAEVVMPGELGLDLEVSEPYDTYLENAVAKAAAFAGASGLVTVADDSGIEVAALDWGPGVRSARWAGDRGRETSRLLEALEGTADRRARMVCALAVATPRLDGEPLVETFTGVIEGTVASERHGSGGFGYDPVFLIDGRTTTAELSDPDKDRISHRGRAVAAALPRLRELLDEH
jgi:XTP/dITP diphosphohydrolase